MVGAGIRQLWQFLYFYIQIQIRYAPDFPLAEGFSDVLNHLSLQMYLGSLN